MTPAEMLTLLSVRLEDPNSDIYAESLKVLMINRAQTRVFTELNQHVVPELQNRESDLALDENGAFDTSALTGTVLGGISGGVFDVQDATNDYFSRLISFEEYRRSVTRKVLFAQSRPKRYFLGAKSFYLPFTAELLENTDTFVADSFYYVKTFQAGDDFTNIGGANASGSRFKATSSAAATTFTTSVVYKTFGVDTFYKLQPTQVALLTTATSGSLVSGVEYRIDEFAAGDVFTNVGASFNETGQTFTASGTTPTTWTNGSIVSSYTQSFTVESEQVQDAVAFYAEALCWKTNNDSREVGAKADSAEMIETLNTTITATDSNEMEFHDDINDDRDYTLPISTWEV